MASQNSPSTGRVPTNNSNMAAGSNVCPYGQKHAPHHCFTINPAKRPKGWQIRQPVVARINAKLHADSALRKNVLQLGYEHYAAPPTVNVNTHVTKAPSTKNDDSKKQLVTREQALYLTPHTHQSKVPDTSKSSISKVSSESPLVAGVVLKGP